VTPRIVYLNGCSSAGKTSLACALQDALTEPYLHVCIDAFEDMMPRHYEGRAFTNQDVLNRLIPGMHASIRALANGGNNLIVDHILIADTEPENWVADGLACVAGFDVLMVGVRCPLETLVQRERDRGDRPIGIAAWQFERVHRDIPYDLELDTSILTTEACRDLVLEALGKPNRPVKPAQVPNRPS
jgi:chloramphenicol 3-O phosphotransferase